jgi:hypothetical protein
MCRERRILPASAGHPLMIGVLTVVPGAFSGRHKGILSLLPTKKQLSTSYQLGTLPAKRARRKAQTQQSCYQVSTGSLFPLLILLPSLSFKQDELGSARIVPRKLRVIAGTTQGISQILLQDFGKFHRQIAESYTVPPVVLLDRMLT